MIMQIHNTNKNKNGGKKKSLLVIRGQLTQQPFQ